MTEFGKLMEAEYNKQYNIVLNARILSLYNMPAIIKEKPMAPDETKKLQVFKSERLTPNDVPPVEIRITVKQQDIGSTTSIFLKPDAFEGTSDKWLSGEIARMVEKISEQFREEYFFNVSKEKTHGKNNH